MDISSLNNISSSYIKAADALQGQTVSGNEKNDSFDSVLKSAMSMVNQTDSLQNVAEQEEIKYALGYSENTHDLTVAQEKANVALQYTVTVRDKFLEAYNQIMNIQI
ncbi:flagellar hook-basal body complex protein FliE [Anaerosacchariphilus polymeriproducens]|uniref:Flagellar hook-basal body complex protein FliE n=1 Tax=Anaerosacchariphilus polymeriproducens TaxID=1812858 RepID=A0A371AS89_9FIRM|nr:flagellar hook-basal body complex protein FliE [Anaerosacchariphilus polymeriproducens]RDU22438.1 flagellar hook-basal body complex protein FliE [Anaerosacchariphilus polymeriproducens]